MEAFATSASFCCLIIDKFKAKNWYTVSLSISWLYDQITQQSSSSNFLWITWNVVSEVL
jgi:hypothetical protein